MLVCVSLHIQIQKVILVLHSKIISFSSQALQILGVNLWGRLQSIYWWLWRKFTLWHVKDLLCVCLERLRDALFLVGWPVQNPLPIVLRVWTLSQQKWTNRTLYMNIITTKLYIVGEKLKNYNRKDQEDYGTSKTTTTCSKSKSAKGKAANCA